MIRDLIPTPDGGYLCYREDKSRGETLPDNLSGLWKVDSLGNFERFLMERTEIYPKISSQFLFNLYPANGDGEIGLTDQYTYDIFHTDGEEITKYMRFDLPRKRIVDFPGIELGRDVEEPFYHLHHNTEKGDMVFTEWVGSPEGRYFVTVYSKLDGTFETGRSAFVRVDDQPIPVFMNVATTDPSVMVSTIGSVTILSVLENPDIPAGMKAIFEKFTEGKADREQIEEMNPVLMLSHIKNSLP